MGRFSPRDFLRFRQALPGELELTFGGAEANVAVSLALLGGRSKYVTALPDHDISRACVSDLGGLGVDTSGIKLVSEGRMGLYFVEKGANQRPSRVIYDREHSAISMTRASDYNWEEQLAGAGWLHITGITPSLSEEAAGATHAAAETAKKKGLTVSCDLNFRKKLWKWKSGTGPGDLAQATMRRILPNVDVVIANEEDAHDVLGISAENTDVESGKLDAGKYTAVAREIVRQFPNVGLVAITLRESISATHNNWGAMLYDAQTDKVYFAPEQDGKYAPYEIRFIVDRVGGGDSFGAGLIFALNTPELAGPADAIRFATAASCLAHSVSGDFNFVTRTEVETLMGGSASGRVVR